MLVYILCIIPLMVLSALFSGTETAFACVNKIRLKHMAEKGDKRAETALRMAEHYEQALTAILVGNNIANIGSSSLATLLFTELCGSAGAAVSTIVMTLLVLTFCEVLPKSFAKSRADQIALRFGSILSGFTKLMTPFVKFFDMISKIFKPKEEAPTVTEDELKFIIDEIEEEGVLEEQESDLVISALQLDETTVSEILIPRVNITGVSSEATIEEIQNIFLNTQYSRIPVYEKSLDNIIGMITNKDFFRLQCGAKSSLQEIIQDVIYVPEAKSLSDMLKEMQRSKTHLAIVVDAYGGTKGLVTLEDIMEELVGEIYDESDIVTKEITHLGKHVYRLSGGLSLSAFYRNLEEEDKPTSKPEATAVTIGGWITELMGHIPKPGDAIRWNQFCFIVTEVRQHCVKEAILEIESEPKELQSKD